MLQTVKKQGNDASKYKKHNFREGGATAAAVSRVPDWLSKHHVHWWSESAIRAM